MISNVGPRADLGRELNCGVWPRHEFEDAALFGCGDGNGTKPVSIMAGAMGVATLDEECKGSGYLPSLALSDDGLRYDVAVADAG